MPVHIRLPWLGALRDWKGPTAVWRHATFLQPTIACLTQHGHDVPLLFPTCRLLFPNLSNNVSYSSHLFDDISFSLFCRSTCIRARYCQAACVWVESGRSLSRFTSGQCNICMPNDCCCFGSLYISLSRVISGTVSCSIVCKESMDVQTGLDRIQRCVGVWSSDSCVQYVFWSWNLPLMAHGYSVSY